MLKLLKVQYWLKNILKKTLPRLPQGNRCLVSLNRRIKINDWTEHTSLSLLNVRTYVQGPVVTIKSCTVLYTLFDF